MCFAIIANLNTLLSVNLTPHDKGVILPPDHFRGYNSGNVKDTEMPLGDFVNRSMGYRMTLAAFITDNRKLQYDGLKPEVEKNCTIHQKNTISDPNNIKI